MTTLSTYDPTPFLKYLSHSNVPHSKAEIAEKLGYSERQLLRWEKGESLPPQHILKVYQRLLDFTPLAKNTPPFTIFSLYEISMACGGNRIYSIWIELALG